MRLLKNLLSVIVVLQLFVIITVITQHSLEKINDIYKSSLISNINPEKYPKNITLAEIKREKNNILNSFNYIKFQQTIYNLWLKHNNKLILTQKVETKAKKLLGKPYVWGATGPNCFDCSGFTQKVYKVIGVNLPRVSKNQAQVGELVHFDELKEGDMVFFDTSKKYQGKVNHVGIYLGDNKFIHASSGNHKVVITDFNKKIFYKKCFLWGRRIIKNKVEYASNFILIPH